MTDPRKKTAPLSTSLRVICTDYDGTLAEGDGRPISDCFFDRITAWRQLGELIWIVNTGRTFPSLEEDLLRRKAPIWPNWVVALEREIWLVRDRRGVGWFEWNRKCELMHAQLFETVHPVWKNVEDYITRHTKAKLVEDAGSPLGIIASCEEEADEISAFMTPLLANWPMLVAVRNSIYFRFSHKFYHKGACLEAISSGLAIIPQQIFVAGDHLNDLPMLDQRYARHIACPGNSVDDVKKKVRAHGGHVAKAHTAEGTVEALDKLCPLPKRSV
jgi:hydroxymethylpyrimidine pyrophosphatase-like HAD family hydrolase